MAPAEPDCPDPLLAGLNPPQHEAALHGEGPLLILAGAGSGKTRVIVHRIAHLIEQGTPAGEILAVTFTNKAAGELKERVARLVGPVAGGVWVSTFHSFCAKLLRLEHEAAGLPRDFTIYDDQDTRSLLKRIVAELTLPARSFAPRIVASRISGAKDKLIGPGQFAKLAFDDFGRTVARIYELYQQRLGDCGAVDFDDLILRVVDTFGAKPEARRRWSSRFQHILVDEYQDTNLAQVRLVEALAKPRCNLCVVGDDDQSIYAWRGADIRNILEFEKSFPGAKIIRLEQNYRSTPTILEAAHAVVRGNLNRREKKLWSALPDGDKITVVYASSDREEADWIVERVRGLCATKGAKPGDCAVLYRANAQSRALEEALKRHVLPYVLFGGHKFYQREEIKNTLAYAALMVNPRDDVAFRRAAASPRRGLGDVALGKLEVGRQARGISWFDLLDDAEGLADVVTGRAFKIAAAFGALLEELRGRLEEMSLSEWIGMVIRKTDMISCWEGEDRETIANRAENLAELVAAFEDYERNNEEPTLAGFLENAALVTDTDRIDPAAGAVSLMTLHAAKGLEFRNVFIVGCDEGLFPLSRALEHPDQLEEERRLFYVGSTRAQERLFLSHARTRGRTGGALAMRSRFLGEVPAEHCEIVNLIAPGHLDGTGIGYEAEGYRRGRVAGRTRFASAGDSRGTSGVGHRPVRGRLVRKRGHGESSGATATEQPDPPREETLRLERAELALLQAGTKVRHPKYGDGEVIEVSGNGDGMICRIAFSSGFTMKIMPHHAPLRIL